MFVFFVGVMLFNLVELVECFVFGLLICEFVFKFDYVVVDMLVV